MTRSENTPRQAWKFAEFFAGIGLVRIGLERSNARWHCVLANDLDPIKCAIYRKQFPDVPADELVEGDIHGLTSKQFPGCDLATASFPCTDLSLAGSRLGIHSGQSSAFWGFAKLLESSSSRKRPRLVLLENVLGLLSSKQGRDFEAALRAMNNLGYAVDPFVLDAKWFVPQSRPRLFIVCTKKSLARQSLYAIQTIQESRIRPKRLVEFINATSSGIDYAGLNLPEPPREGPTLASIIADPPNDHADWWNDERRDYTYDQMFPRHQAWIDENLGSRIYRYGTAFRRVRPQPDGTKRSMAELRSDGIAGCLRTPKGGSGRQILIRVGRGKLAVRLISPRECARLMGARDFKLNGISASHAYHGFGDAVCVDAVSWIACNYLEKILRLSDGSAVGYPDEPKNIAESHSASPPRS